MCMYLAVVDYITPDFACSRVYVHNHVSTCKQANLLTTLADPSSKSKSLHPEFGYTRMLMTM